MISEVQCGHPSYVIESKASPLDFEEPDDTLDHMLQVT